MRLLGISTPAMVRSRIEPDAGNTPRPIRHVVTDVV